MSRIDVAKIRKERGMSQQALAEKLGITQSFMSAIETGKSPLPDNKRRALSDIFNISDFSPYVIVSEECQDQRVGDISLAELESDESVLNKLLARFHARAHREIDSLHESLQQKISVLQEQNTTLLSRNLSLESRNEALESRLSEARAEINRLTLEIAELRNSLGK